jgi:hypothetical protein
MQLQQWKLAEMVYHATNEVTLATAEQSDTLVFKSGHVQHSRPCSLFSCNLWQGCRPTISPYASNRVVISPTDVLRCGEDYLLPVKPYDVPVADPDKSHRSAGGRTYIEMVYVAFDEVNLKLTPDERSYMEAWKLNNHPFIRLLNNGLHYRDIQDVWWIILTLRKVSIPNNAVWELDLGGCKEAKKPRWITNEVTRKVVNHITCE